MKKPLLIGFAAILLLLSGTSSGSEPPGREKTFLAYCQHPSHGRRLWFTSAYTSVGPALMFAGKHNEANPGHEATIAVLHGAEPAHNAERR
jgi:hypothetical protein